MKKNELISIIVPVYNVEKYLKKCIESIISQTYHNIEILLINDESTDNSGKICDEYAVLDSRIKVLHKNNGGAASARNLGITVARGDYIGFVDADDWIEHGMYESMYCTIKKDNSDVCYCNYIIEEPYKIQRKIILPFTQTILKKDDIKKYIIAKLISSFELSNKSDTMHGAVWRMLIKRELIKQNRIQFILDMMEDKIFNIQILFKCNLVSVDPGFHYHYCIHPFTSSTKYRENLFLLLEKINTRMEEIVKQENAFDLFEERLSIQLFKFATMSIVNEIHPHNKKLLREKLQTINHICSNKKLTSSISRINSINLSIKKAIVLNALKNNESRFLYFYYYFASGYYNLKKKLEYKTA